MGGEQTKMKIFMNTKKKNRKFLRKENTKMEDCPLKY